MQSEPTTSTATIATFPVLMTILLFLGRPRPRVCLPRQRGPLTRVPGGAKVRPTGLTVSLRNGGEHDPFTVPRGGRRRPAVSPPVLRFLHGTRPRAAEA